MTLFKSNTLEIIARNDTILGAIVKDHRKAFALNKILKRYPSGTSFRYSEALFIAPKLELIAALVKVRLLNEDAISF